MDTIIYFIGFGITFAITTYLNVRSWRNVAFGLEPKMLDVSLNYDYHRFVYHDINAFWMHEFLCVLVSGCWFVFTPVFILYKLLRMMMNYINDKMKIPPKELQRQQTLKKIEYSLKDYNLEQLEEFDKELKK